MDRPLAIGIIGDWNPDLLSHRATDAAMRHAATALCVGVECSWLPTLSLEGEGAERALSRHDALWCAPGSPYASMSGALAAIRYAREGNRPFLGT